MILRIFLALGLLLTITAPAHAAPAQLQFRDEPRDAREESVINYLESSKKLFSELPFKIAAVDLNDDGVDEWIVRQDKSSACEPNVECEFLVVALKKNAPLLIGHIRAGKVGIDEFKSYGVVNLRVYNIKNNDFEYSVYRWTPEKAAFLP